MELVTPTATLLFLVLLSLMLPTSSSSSGVLKPGGDVEEADQWVMESGNHVDLSNMKFQASSNESASDAPQEISYLDIVIFPLPPTCTPQYCDYPSVGVGASLPIRFNSAAPTTWCSNGRLYIEDTLFEGHHVSIEVPPTGTMERLTPPTTFRLEQPGHYMVIMANCNPNGREIHFDGSVIFSSRSVVEHEEKHGSLVGVLAVVCIFFFIRRWRQRMGGGFSGGGGGSYINLELQEML